MCGPDDAVLHIASSLSLIEARADSGKVPVFGRSLPLAARENRHQTSPGFVVPLIYQRRMGRTIVVRVAPSPGTLCKELHYRDRYFCFEPSNLKVLGESRSD